MKPTEEQQTITGEQVEQSLEEKVREILEPLGVHKFDAKSDCVSFNLVGTGRRIHSDRYVMISTMGIEHSHSFDDAPISSNWTKAVNSIAALLTAQPESEQTLEEAVRWILKRKEQDGGIKTIRVDDDSVRIETLFCSDYVITSEYVSFTGKDGESKFYSPDGMTAHEDNHTKAWTDACFEILELLATRSTKPSYSELKQRVEELERELIQQKREADLFREQSNKFDRENIEYFNRIRELERENASLLDKFGPIDQAEQQVAEVETRFQKLAKRAERIADLLIQLNEEIL